MIKKGRNIVLCDNCKKEITLDIEKKYLSIGIVLQYLKCLHCGTKTLIDVTNKSIREKQFELRKWSEQKERTFDIPIDGLNKEEFNKLAKLVSVTESNINRLSKEIRETKAELKIKYEGEL